MKVRYGSGQNIGEVYIGCSVSVGGYVVKTGHCKGRGFVCVLQKNIKLL